MLQFGSGGLDDVDVSFGQHGHHQHHGSLSGSLGQLGSMGGLGHHHQGMMMGGGVGGKYGGNGGVDVVNEADYNDAVNMSLFMDSEVLFGN